jgi:hypothetical protein
MAVERVQKVGRDELVGRPALSGDTPRDRGAVRDGSDREQRDHRRRHSAWHVMPDQSPPHRNDHAAKHQREKHRTPRADDGDAQPADPDASREFRRRYIRGRHAASGQRRQRRERTRRPEQVDADRAIGRGILDAQFVNAAVERYRQRHLPRTVRSGVVDGESIVDVQVGTGVRYQRDAPDAAVTENQIPLPDRRERLIGKRPVAPHDVGRHARVDRRDGRTIGEVRSGEVASGEPGGQADEGRGVPEQTRHHE